MSQPRNSPRWWLGQKSSVLDHVQFVEVLNQSESRWRRGGGRYLQRGICYRALGPTQRFWRFFYLEKFQLLPGDTGLATVRGWLTEGGGT